VSVRAAWLSGPPDGCRTEALMFGFQYDKIEWMVGVLLLGAMALAAFA
jgi:hypothetical protein